MTTRNAPSTRLFTCFPVLVRVLAACAVIATTAAPLAQAEPPSTPATATQPKKPEKKTKATSSRKNKGDPGKAKAPRPAKSAKTAAQATATAGSNDRAADSAKPSQVVDFDTDQVEGQRMEPGFELIEGAPQKAKHRSLVEPLKPGDSVVNRE
jgi:hypothetical protein